MEVNMNMGKGTQVNTERNMQLIADYQLKNKDGTPTHSVTQVANKYDISPQRLYKILKSYGVPLNRPKDNISKFNNSKS
jgi:DNA-binding phage protein